MTTWISNWNLGFCWIPCSDRRISFLGQLDNEFKFTTLQRTQDLKVVCVGETAPIDALFVVCFVSWAGLGSFLFVFAETFEIS